MQLGRESGDTETLVRAVDFPEFGPLTRLQVFLELGDWPHLDGELAAMSQRLERAPRPMEVLWWQEMRAARAQTRGDWQQAERLIAASFEIASGPEYGTAFQLLLSQQLVSAWQRGEDLRPLIGTDVLPAGPMRTSWEAGLLGWTCDRLPVADVERELDRLLAEGMDSVRPDLTFGPVTSALAMAAAEVGSRRHAATLYDGLAPYADQWAGTGGAVVNGPFALHLGRLAAVLDRPDEALELLDHAARRATGGGCIPWQARVALAQAELATDPLERRRAGAIALDLAESVEMGTVAERALRLTTPGGLPAGLTEREVEALRLLAGGATNAQIAAAMFLSVKTVERHLVSAYRKAGVRNRAEAATFTQRELGP